jgi:small subunit ribosomal protein S11
MVKQLKRSRLKPTSKKRTGTNGVVHIKSSFNNTIVNISDPQGNTLAWSSSGEAGFKGARKRTPYAAQSAAAKVVSIAYAKGLRKAEVVVSGAGRGRDSAIRAVKGRGLAIVTLKDNTPLPHNGCRPPKKRRV